MSTTAERRAKNDALIERNYAEGYDALMHFAARNGVGHIPSGTMEDGVSLSVWVRNQRSLYRNGSLSDRKVSELEAIPGWTW